MSDLQRPVTIATVLLGTACAMLLIAGTQAFFTERIDVNRQRAAMLPLLQALPAAQRDTSIFEPAGTLHDAEMLALREPTPLYRIHRDGKLVGWMIPATAPQGYNGDIDLITAVSVEGEVIGTQILRQRETPGLGERILRTQTNWLDHFNGRSLHNPSVGAWYVTKDGGNFDELTGATVTSRAVTRAVQRTLAYFLSHADDFANAGASPQAASDAGPAHE